MKILVLTTVHHPDDTRIRERLIRTLASRFEVTYASRTPGPTDLTGLVWVPLRGNRLRRWFGSAKLALFNRYQVIVLHDPELIPIGFLGRLRRRSVVFDLHENLPEQASSKAWVPHAIRPLMRWVSRMALKAAERSFSVTLAEEGYRRLFKKVHEVFPNYPCVADWPEVAEGDGSAVYVGDVAPLRGLRTAVMAVGLAGVPLRIIGPVTERFRNELQDLADREGSVISFTGRLPNSEALAVASTASVALSPLNDVGNYRNSLPTKLLEYAALGLPIVATDLPGTREILEEVPSAILVRPEDPEAMAAAIKEMASEEWKKKAWCNRMEFRRRWVWPEEAVLSFYSGLLR